MLEAVALRLKVGNINIGNHFVSYNVISKDDIISILRIFLRSSRFPLNTSKNLNYLMCTKKGMNFIIVKLLDRFAAHR